MSECFVMWSKKAILTGFIAISWKWYTSARMGKATQTSFFPMGKKCISYGKHFSPFTGGVKIHCIFNIWFCFYFLCHAKPTYSYAFLEERELYPVTISLRIGVPFSGSGFNGVFLCVLFMWSSHLFSQSYKFSNKISLSWYFSLCITYLMIFITFFPLNPGSINFLYPSEYREFYWCFIARVSYCFNCDAPRHPWIMLKCY